MVRVEDIARAALDGEALEVRSLVQDLLREPPDWETLGEPDVRDERVRVLTAGLVELLAGRSGAVAPAWTRAIGPAAEPIHLVREAATLPRTRRMIETESPEPLRKRNIFAPAGYAEIV